MILPKAAERFMRAFPKAVRIMPAGRELPQPDEKRLAVAMEWELDRARRWEERVKDDDDPNMRWSLAPDVNWKTTTGKWLIKRYEIAD
jgi:anti-sigma factor ChrR (cupin superfamily)